VTLERPQREGDVVGLSSTSRIFPGFTQTSQGKVERRSLIDGALGQMRPPCRVMMRRTVASPTPVPSNSAAECRRWNTPNSLSMYFMSKPAPLSRT